MWDAVPRLIVVALVGAGLASCGDPGSDPIEPGALEARPALVTDRARYVAEPFGPPGRYRQFAFRIRARFTNPGTRTRYLQRCLPSSPHPLYGVRPETAIESEAAWDPAWACTGHDAPIAVAPGESRTDSLALTGPTVWMGDDQRAVGVLSGRFRLRYSVSRCREQNTCFADPIESLSNEFEVIVRD